jgi:hypothetical protein
MIARAKDGTVVEASASNASGSRAAVFLRVRRGDTAIELKLAAIPATRLQDELKSAISRIPFVWVIDDRGLWLCDGCAQSVKRVRLEQAPLGDGSPSARVEELRRRFRRTQRQAPRCGRCEWLSIEIRNGMPRGTLGTYYKHHGWL